MAVLAKQLSFIIKFVGLKSSTLDSTFKKSLLFMPLHFNLIYFIILRNYEAKFERKIIRFS